jgi:hypothetical protein
MWDKKIRYKNLEQPQRNLSQLIFFHLKKKQVSPLPLKLPKPFLQQNLTENSCQSWRFSGTNSLEVKSIKGIRTGKSRLRGYMIASQIDLALLITLRVS